MGWLEKGPSASLFVRYVSHRICSSLTPRIQTLLKSTVCLLLVTRCTSASIGLAPQEVIYSLIERIRRFQMRNMSNVRQFHESGAGDSVSRFLCQFRHVSEVPPK